MLITTISTLSIKYHALKLYSEEVAKSLQFKMMQLGIRISTQAVSFIFQLYVDDKERLTEKQYAAA
jgi:hypothetical protein